MAVQFDASRDYYDQYSELLQAYYDAGGTATSSGGISPPTTNTPQAVRDAYANLQQLSSQYEVYQGDSAGRQQRQDRADWLRQQEFQEAAATRTMDEAEELQDHRIALQNQIAGQFGLADGGEGGEGGGGLNTAQTEGVSVIQSLLGENLADLDTYGQAERSRLEQQQQIALNNAATNMERRGLGASNLYTSAQASVYDTFNQSFLDLSDRQVGQRVDARQDAAGNLTSLYQSAGNTQADIIRSLLGIGYN